MSLPKFDLQGFLFESLGSIAPYLFDEKVKYKLFATKVWPLLAGCREELAQCYEPENGRPGMEPVVLLGVLIFQFRPHHYIVAVSVAVGEDIARRGTVFTTGQDEEGVPVLARFLFNSKTAR